MQDLTGKVALITGASSGIGPAAARLLADDLPAEVTRTMLSFLSHPRTRLNVLGAAVLVAGMGIAGFLYRSIPQDDAQTDADILLAQEQFKGYDQAVQRNIGATGLLAVHATETLENLAKPRPLAILSMTVSGVVAGGFFVAASRRRDRVS